MIMQYIVGPKVKVEVEALITRACPSCGHSGWKDKTNQEYIEDNCPNCGTPRPPKENKGLIYSNDPWWLLKRRIKRWFGIAA